MEQIKTIEITCQGATLTNIDDLTDLQGNLKDLYDEDYARLRNSIIQFGFSFPIFFWEDKETNLKYIVDAHQRVRTLLKMRSEGIEIPPLPADPIFAKNKIEAKEKLLLLNSRYGKMTQEGYDEFISDIPMDDISDLLAIDEVMIDGASADVKEDEAPEVDETQTISKLGEVYQLGRHRLMCGDATKIEDVKKLMNGQKADMVFTDPPYGINIVGKNKTAGNFPGTNAPRTIAEPIIGDDKPFDPTFLLNLAPIIALWGGNNFADRLPAHSKWLVWDKKEGAFEGSDLGDAELAWTNQDGACRLLNNTWQGMYRKGEGERESRVHPTQKPIKLMSWGIEQLDKNANNILDLFGGSGSTLIACEQTNRTCYMMELDPKYCDVIRKRYWKFVNNDNEEGWQINTLLIS